MQVDPLELTLNPRNPLDLTSGSKTAWTILQRMHTSRACAFGLLLLLLVLATQVQAKIRLPGILSDHMVLQRDIPIHLWGWADPCERISVQLGKIMVSATTDELGHWSVYIPPQQPGAPVSIDFRGTNSITLSDVLIGDVWVASGQSNMMMPLVGFPGAPVKNGSQEIANAAHAELRLLTVPTRSSPYRLDDFSASWKACTPESAKDFSAVAYFFGREIAAKQRVPLGLIDATAGGTPAEAMEKDGCGRVWFEHAAGLADADGRSVEGFEVTGPDHAFESAEAHIDGASVVVSSAEIKHPVYVRYAWANAPVANLVNAAGLPASTFTSEGRLSDVFLLRAIH
jgi:hypothetical protein